MIDISIVVPLYNEDESLPELEAWIRRVMESNAFSYEILLVDDGSNDNSWKVIETLQTSNPCVKGIKFRRNYGKSAALNVGFKAAAGNVVITMDADLQDSPDEIPELYRMIKEDNFHLVSGWKQKRYDPITKTVPTKIYNWATRRLSGIHNLHDFNCGLKAYQHQVIKSVEVYGEMHRYIPVLAKWAGFGRIGEKVVQHQARKYGTTKFGLERFVFGLLDLMSLTFVGKFGKRPMHLFGTLGISMFLIGFGTSLYLGIEKWWSLSNGIKLPLVTSNPMFFIALTTMLLGTMLFLAGFLAELIARTDPNRDDYQIEKVI
jgi:glycosyltransferase involved in cell wall biosynthesis